MKKTNLISVKPGDKVRLKDIDTGGKGAYNSKEETFERLKTLETQLAKLQERLYAEHKRSLLIVLQATDTGGKDGATKRLFTGVNPAGIQVTSFKAPSDLELSHDFLWRIHGAAPPRGMIGVWNRSHYEDVLITRVHGLIDQKTAQKRFESINNFEQMLVENGTVILKFFLHISKKEQKERLQARLDNPEKNWKFNPGDLKERALWSDYQDAYQDVLNHCSTENAPWNIVPADHKWARDIALCESVTAALEEMNPQFPKVDFDPQKIKVD
ncbi:polyphosphate:nucleotide phosphotransferase, PPK2 family [Abditibacterium utsteinense]|uniref:Polyphosphate:nucleotide phosphotransferase, PPK2 family n=1 Tax=Abditibacterium utsteinense TaxID=1960156 RepID=A0A2S8SUR7_9BACT|nr:polyphosphate kinase 2 family protein [Abditibacterium utsteinense]PQV64534.1 polyphosphate:nucleotide phosphotransferase, PPK2 family [Abditibacterium utsteinense]